MPNWRPQETERRARGECNMYGTLYRHVLLPLFDGPIKGRRTLEYWRTAEESQWWPRERLEAFQAQALRNLLRHAANTCPYYQQTWNELGLDAARVESLADFRSWPLLTREVVRAERLRLRTRLPIKLLTKSTGGSSGQPLQFDLCHDSNDRRTAMMYRGYGWAGGQPGTKQVHIWGTPVGNLPRWKRWKGALHHWLERHLVLSCFEFTPERMEAHRRALERYRPDVIVAYTNPLYEFARFLKERGCRPSVGRSVIVGAEKLYDFQRDLIEEVFQVPVFETYGSREVMLIGAECELHCGLHVSMENLLVEVVDDDGRPTPPGEEGNVVVTDLFNYGMPFIRYVNGDRAVVRSESCPCGRGLTLLQKVTGRRLDVLDTPSGRKIPGEFFPHLIKEFPAVRRFQVVQEQAEAITVKLVTDGGFTLADRQLLRDEIRRATGGDVEVDLQFVSDIPLTRAGKHNVVVRRIPLRSDAGASSSPPALIEAGAQP
jgi:phenylacetate-CoA ligase